MKYLYYIYQLCVAFPITIVVTIVITTSICLCCLLGGGDKPSYYLGKWWGWAVIRAFLLPVTVEGRENIAKGQSYVFIANHQGSFDIFLLYGFLGREFKWMMKEGIKKIPFVGYRPGTRDPCWRHEHGCVPRRFTHLRRQDDTI